VERARPPARGMAASECLALPRLVSSPLVYLAAVLEYLAAEVRESAGSAARDNKKQHIVPRHLQLANRNAAVLEYLTVEVLLCQGWSPVSLFISLLFSNILLPRSWN